MNIASTEQSQIALQKNEPGNTIFIRVCAGLAMVLLLAMFIARFLWLDTLPGINGDEAFAGVQVAHWLRGASYTLQTPTGNFIDPFFVVTEALLLKIFSPSFILLRLPIAIWSCVGLILNFILCRRVFGEWRMAMFTTLLLASLPLHLSYSRCGWSPSFILVTAPLVLYPCLLVAQQRAGKWDWILLIVGAVLCLWVHFTSGVFITALFACTFWMRRDRLFQWASMYLRLSRRSATVMLVVGGIAVIRLAIWGLFRLAKLNSQVFFNNALSALYKPLMYPRIMLMYLLIPCNMIRGTRAFEYFAGAPHNPAIEWMSLICMGSLIWFVVYLIREKNAADRLLAWMWIAALFALIATLGVFNLQLPGNERYVLWLLPLYAITFVRGVGAIAQRHGWNGLRLVGLATTVVSVLFLFQCSQSYFLSLRQQTHAATLHRTFKTGSVEPKAAAAELIRRLSKPGAGGEVIAEDWWLLVPLQYLLEPQYDVRGKWNGTATQDVHRERFIIGFSKSAFLAQSVQPFVASGREFEAYDIQGGNGQSILTVVHIPAK